MKQIKIESLNNKTEREPGIRPTSFLFVDHSRESVRNVAGILERCRNSDADIVAMELVGSPRETRMHVETLINQAISEKNLQRRQRITEGLSQGMKDIAWALAGTDKHLRFIDVASDDPEFEMVVRARQLRGKNGYEDAFTESVVTRDELIRRQLDTMRLNDGDELAYLIVLGAVHQGVMRGIDTKSVPSVSYYPNDAKVRADVRLPQENIDRLRVAAGHTLLRNVAD